MSVELLAPAGDFETALAAFDAGADAVYCGLADFSARAFAKNFTSEDLKNLMRVARRRGKRVYVTFNTVIDEDNVEEAVRQLSELDAIRPSALIVQDLGIARLCRTYFPDLEIHASTQLVAHNLEGVLALKELGFARVVLARELSVEEIASIVKRSGGLEFECFVHGALCYSLSGLCLFGAMEKDRSGNRGKCPYCCRLPYEDEEGRKTLAFSMKDLRLGEDVRKLVNAGVCSLKIEGRMKSPLYVASVTKYYRQILGEGEGEGEDCGRKVTPADLETVFSRRTTELYLNGRSGSPIDPTSLGHLGTPIGTVKRITKDREGNAWLRFHTSRALEKHDGLQFSSGDGEKPVGFGISMMRQAISRTPVFEVSAGTDVEILLPEDLLAGARETRPSSTQTSKHPNTPNTVPVRPGMTVYCSMSNAVKRMFPTPSFRPSDYEGTETLDFEVMLQKDCVSASVTWNGQVFETFQNLFLDAAKNPEKTTEGVKKAFAKLGETDYRLGTVTVADPWKLFVPMSVLNDLRRDLVERVDDARDKVRRAKLDKALADEPCRGEALEGGGPRSPRRIKLRADQRLPQGGWDEIVVAIHAETTVEEVAKVAAMASGSGEAGTPPLRMALPVYTAEPDFNRLRTTVKRFLREGYDKWEASDLATLRMLKGAGVTDITADWTLYAFNASALKTLSDLGVKRFVASPENNRQNLQFLAESGYDVEFLDQQSTPLFISLTPPAAVPSAESGLAVFRRDGLWVTTKKLPRTFSVPEGAASRVDLSWSSR